MFGFELALADGNPALADKTRIAGNELDLVLVEIARVNAVETLDIGLAVIDEFGPVVLGHAGGEAIVRRIARVLGEFRRMPHNLLRHTAHVYAGAAEPAALGSQGWLGQAVRDLDPNGSNIVTAVNFGNGLPRALASPGVPVTSVGDLESYGLLTGVVGDRQRLMALNAFSRMYTPVMGGDAVMEYLGKTGLDAMRGADIIKEAPANYSSNVEYPDNPFAQSLKGVAQVHIADLGTRVFYTQYGSFDTHTDEVSLQSSLWSDISSSVEAFYQDLEEHGLGDEVTVLMFSEFGRRVKDNGTGTDHGSGGVAFVMGNQVQGGHYGEYPSLDPAKLVEGDLAYNFDFRGLYTDILEDWLEVEARPIVNGAYEKIRPFG